MSLFDGIRNLFDKEDENDVEVPKKSSWFSPYYALDYQDNKDAYDQANYYWTTGKFPVIEHEEIEKTGYEQDSSTKWDLNWHYSPTSPLYYTNFKNEAIAKDKEQLENEAKEKREVL